MTDRDQILHDFTNNFWYEDSAKIEVDDAGLVHVSNCRHIQLKEQRMFNKLPVKFGSISGDLTVSNNTLQTLEGCPEFVPGNFRCSNTQIKSLHGGPRKVGSSGSSWYEAMFWPKWPLHSLEGLAEEIHGRVYVSYTPRLPLLRLCLTRKVSVTFTDLASDQIDNNPHGQHDMDKHIKYKSPYLHDLETILNDPECQGLAGVLLAVSRINELQEEWGWNLDQNASL